MLTQTEKDNILTGKAAGTTLKELGLRGRGEIFLSNSSCIRLIDRTSRVLRKDAEAFVETLKTANGYTGRELTGYLLIRRAPLCSKARDWLEAQDVIVECIDSK